ncbi:hypothetical protein KGF54_002887 [Candida jiufengensis]|uniref:uncharacterized protein n=1 Tax=Candida jiufengensis TaxID=497108 RepID=UPI00222529B9|nr:uncharacterized protein KGF54_002887 [Candida jiufengensis]KAI5953515.1 hypothetical protein KGF54_002887 [Candida jiufengensis]
MLNQVSYTRNPEFLEKYYICRGSEKFYSNFNISVKYDQPITKNQLSAALRSLILKNSWFIHNFFKVDEKDSKVENYNNWKLKYLEQIKFRDVVTTQNIQKFNESTLEYLNGLTLNHNTKETLWKIILFKEDSGDQWLTVYVDHSMFDGLSLVQFHKDLAKEISLVGNPKEVVETLFDLEKDLEHLPSKPMVASEVATDLYYPTYTKVWNHYLSKYVPGYATVSNWLYPANTNPPLFHSPSPVKKDLTTKYKLLKFSPEQMSKMIKFCKTERVTFTAYMDVMFIKALQNSIFKDYDPTQQFSTHSFIAINGRRYYGEDIRNFKFGTMVTGIHIKTPPVINEIDAMKHLNVELNKEIKSRSYFKDIGMMKYVNLFNYFQSKIGAINTSSTFGISNLGKVATNKDVPIQFKDIVFSANAGVMYGLVLNTITLPNGEMNMVISYIPNYGSLESNNEKGIKRLFNLFEEYLLNGIKA